MSGYDANFRNLGTGDLSTFNGDSNFAGTSDVNPVSSVLEPFLTLACGDTVNSFIDTKSSFSFFRTGDVIQNTKYRARQANMVVDVVGRVKVTVTAANFTPFIAIVRDADDYVISSDGSGLAEINVTEETEGPLTIEVTSIEPYATGDFTINVTCGNKAPTVTTITALPNPSYLHDKVVYTIKVKDPDGGVPTGDVIVSDDSGTLGTVTLVDGEITYSTAKQPVGSHVVTAAYQGDDDYEVSSGHVTEVIIPRVSGCPTGDLQLDDTTVTFINDYLTWRHSLGGDTEPDFDGLVPHSSNCEWLIVAGNVQVLISEFTGPSIIIQVEESTPPTNTAIQLSGDATWPDPTGTYSVSNSQPGGFEPANPPNWPPPTTVTLTFA